jgi:hypothetical protein
MVLSIRGLGTGIIALVDEATGYQKIRAEHELEEKISLNFTEEMRKWEKTFPDELWDEFARLTGFVGERGTWPQCWAGYVNSFIYEAMDPDLYAWLKANDAPSTPGHRYHQRFNEQVGLPRLHAHMWLVIGIARMCSSIAELREAITQRFGVTAQYLHDVSNPPRNL